MLLGGVDELERFLAAGGSLQSDRDAERARNTAMVEGIIATADISPEKRAQLQDDLRLGRRTTAQMFIKAYEAATGNN